MKAFNDSNIVKTGKHYSKNLELPFFGIIEFANVGIIAISTTFGSQEIGIPWSF